MQKLRLRDLKGLGQKSEQDLIEVGVTSPTELHNIGAVCAFMKLHKANKPKPSLNFLYALVGAIENKHWTEITRTEKSNLLMQIEGHRELEELFASENADTNGSV